MKLSEHFSLSEFTISQTASRKGIDNMPNEKELCNLQILAKGLEDVRTKLGGLPITISSGYRSVALNDAIGGSKTSYHSKGLAADFVCPSYGSIDDVFHAILSSSIEFQQLIKEYDSWIHIAFPEAGEKARRQALVIDKDGTRHA